MKNIILILLTIVISRSLSAQSWNEVIKVVASDRESDDWFGRSVAISGSYAIIGAESEDHDAFGKDSLYNAGSAYIFELDNNGNWAEIQKIVASDRESRDKFGTSVAVSGNYTIVGASNDKHDDASVGSAYIFERDHNGIWVETQKIVAPNREESTDFFGHSVAISGNYAIIGANFDDYNASGKNPIPNAGSAYIFERDNDGNWTKAEKIVASDRGPNEGFGSSVSISGNYAIVGPCCDSGGGLYGAGAAYIFERDNNGNWVEEQKIIASDRATSDFFGYSVAISNNYAIVGARWEDHDATGGNSMSSAGSAYIFERNNNGYWTEVKKIVASDRESDDWFGGSVSVSGDYAIVGAFNEDEDVSGANSMPSAGSAYIFERDSNGYWAETQKIVASDRASHDGFFSVCISGNYVIAGAFKEDEDSFGENTMSSAGSAYIFNYGDIITNIVESSFENKLTLYPNPSKGNIIIEFDNNYNIVHTIIRNPLGQEFLNKTITTTNKISLQIDGNPGIYFIELKTDGGKKAVLKAVKE